MAVLLWRYRFWAVACGVSAACSGGAAAAVLRHGLRRGGAAEQWRCCSSGSAAEQWRCYSSVCTATVSGLQCRGCLQLRRVSTAAAVPVLGRGLRRRRCLQRWCCGGGSAPWPASSRCCFAVLVLQQWRCSCSDGAPAVAVLRQWRCRAVACSGAATVALMQLWRLLCGTSCCERISILQVRYVSYCFGG